MAVVTGDRYLESLVKFVEKHAGPLIEGTLVLKLNPIGLHYVQSRLEALSELEGLLSGAPVDYLRAYVSDLGDHRAIEQLRRILRLLPSLKVVSVLPPPARDPVPLSLLPFGRLKFLELRGCDLSTSAARGLLELRHTLEKIICHNSTDALRHIFASRISEIKDSSQWNRLSFVSCACNGLLLMDESLQLLPVVETLDLSRNRFAKVDNLRKCTRLKHLDLGFNQLRTVSSFAEVSCQIVKLVLRNNALTTLHGIENLKSLEGLDLSYNIISKFSDLEIIAGLPSLQNLWLEGNPLCGARWYREQVFSIFPHPHKLELDEKKISTREFWKRKIIIASRQKQPASFGFYSPAIGNAELQGIINTKRRKHSRLACIESEEQNINTGSDQESVSCENEMRSKEENIISDEEAADLMNRFELIKKERSSLWLQEFKEWLNHDSENFMDGNNHNMDTLNPDLEHYMKPKKRNPCVGESSRYVSDSVQASGDESSTNILDSDCSFADISSGFNAYQYFDQISEAGSKVFVNSMPLVGRTDTKKEEMKSFVSIRTGNSLFDTFSVLGGENKTPKISVVTNNAIDDIMESYTPSIGPGSPPHYQEDILHRRHNLEEEILQLSAESYSMASSDSNTSCSEDDFTEFGLLIPEGDQSLIEHFSERSGHLSVPRSEDKYYDKEHGINQATGNGVYLSDTHAEPIPGALKHTELDQLSQRWLENFSTGECDKQKADWSEKKTCRKKPKKRFVLLSQGNDNLDGENKDLAKLNGEFDLQKDSVGYERERQILYGSPQKSIDNKQTWDITITTAFSSNGVATPSGVQSSIFGLEDLIEDFFNCQIADLGVNETCTMCICCSYIVEQKSVCKEVEVAVLLSTEHKLYFLLIYSKNDGSGISLRLMACHQIEDVHIILVGLGLQLLRVYIERRTTYLFATRSIDKSRQLLSILHSFDLDPRKEKFSIKSFEQMQFELFEKQICGGSRISIFQYSMVLFWCNNMKEDLWLSRSLFVLKEHLFLCIEEFVQFGFLSEDTASPYFLPDSCCSIVSVSDMVIDTRVDWCLILTIDCTSKFCTSHKTKKIQDAGPTEKQPVSGSLIWKLKWFSEGSLFNFVALLKAIHAGVSSSPLLVRCVS